MIASRNWFHLCIFAAVFLSALTLPNSTCFSQGAWIPANADLSYPRTLVKLQELPALRDWIVNNADMHEYYSNLYADAWSLNPTVLVSNQDRRVAAHTAKNCAYVFLLNRKPMQPTGLDTLTTTEANTFRNKAIHFLEIINTNVETYPDFGNYIWRANEITDNMIAYDLLKGAGVPDSTLAVGRGKLIEYATNFHTQVAFNSFGLGLTSLHVDNHTLRACGALGMSAVVLNDATSSSADAQPSHWMQTALWNINNVLWGSANRQSDAGQLAGYSEGPHYLRFGMRHCLEFFHAMGNFLPDTTLSVGFDGHTSQVRHPFFDPKFDLLWEWVMRIRMPDGRDPQIEDCFAQTFNADMTFTEKSRFRPTYHGSRFNFTAPTTTWDQLHHSSDDIAADFISAMTPPSTDTFPLLQVLPISGDVIMRSGWDTTSTYMHIAAKHGRTRSSANGHNHVDVTGIILHARGQELAIDPGYLKWERRDQVDGPGHHNMILVDGLGPNEATTGVAGDADGYAGKEFDFQKMDYAEVQTSYQGTSITRKPIFVRGDYFWITDEVVGSQAHAYDWQMNVLGLEGGDSTHGSFVLDSAGQSAIWSKNGVNLHVMVSASGGLTRLTSATAIHELRYDSMETHTALHAVKELNASTRFLAALIPFESDSPDVDLLCAMGCDAMRVRRGGFVDIAFLRNSVAATESGLAQDLYSDATMTFYSEDSSGQFSQFLLEKGTLLKSGADTLAVASVASNWALGRMDSTSYEAYAGAAGTIYFYGLGFVPGSVLGWNVVQSWTYDAGLDRLEVVIAGEGRFTIHEDVIIGNSSSIHQPAALEIWPNPSSGIVQMKTSLTEGRLQIFSVDGRMVMEQEFSTEVSRMDLGKLRKGVYEVRVLDKWLTETGNAKLILE